MSLGKQSILFYPCEDSKVQEYYYRDSGAIFIQKKKKEETHLLDFRLNFP